MTSRCRTVSLLFLGVACAATAAPLAAQHESHEAYQVPAVRVMESPSIDGVLDEAIWRDAAVIRDFIQQEPAEGAPATERTEVQVVYNGSSLFIGVRAFDSSHEPPRATEMRRDADRILEEDNFQVILDTFMDTRTAYMFAVTPLGAQLDQQIFDEGGRDRRGSSAAVNKEWDGVWAVGTSRASDHWVAEIEIPMVTLRFPDSDVQSWGINFMRNIRRKNEQVFWAPIPREFGLTRVSLAGSLRNLEQLDRGLDLRVKPYVTSGGRWTHDLNLSNGYDNDTKGDVGLDVKYGITAGLNLDVTVNTDFAQADVDNEQVNLTRFALFFPEKREFFLENAGLFTVGTPNSTGRIVDLFFSRRIGLTDTGGTVPILGGARLTGKIGSNNLAVMDLQTDDALGHPGENFLVARYSRDLGRSQIGALVVNKDQNIQAPSSGAHHNRTIAADMNLVLSDALTIDGFLAQTQTTGLSGDDVGGHLRAGWLDRSWRVYAEYTDLDDNFNPEVGYVPRVAMRRSKIHLEHDIRPGRWGIRMMDPMWNVTYITDQSGRLESRQFHHMIGTYFDNGAQLVLWYNRYFERIDQTFRVGGVAINPGDYNFWDTQANFRSDPSRRLYYGARIAPQRYYGGDRLDMSGSIGFRVTDQFAVQGEFSRNDVSLPNGDFVADIASLQLDYAFSPTLSLRSLTQRNSLTDQISTSARLRYMFRPGSDIYLVYDEIRRDSPWVTDPLLMNEYRDRQLLLKMTYLFSF
ncbi:MAG: DUF5916 domain-containing protein [Gemmatimonadales bacterium]